MQSPAPIGTDLSRAAQLLRAGKLVAIPTETVYGLAANALDERAVAAIFLAKNRPRFDPLIIHLPNWLAARAYVREIPEKANLLADAFLPGPLTLLLDRNNTIPDLVTAGHPRVGVRIPAHPMARNLLKQLDFPLAAPSANPFGYISPTIPQHVQDQLGDRLHYILDGGPSRVGVESTIVGFEEDKVIIFRKGGIAVERIEAVLGHSVVVQEHSTSNPSTPGQLRSHYAPSGRVCLFDKELPDNLADSAVLAWQGYFPEVPRERQWVLSKTGDLAEAAHRLFAGLRALDALGCSVIYAQLVPEEGLGRAINDRLRRAAAE